MFDHFEVEIRDLKDGIPFASKVKDGFVVSMGATLLRHQFVINEDKSSGQPIFLPFRDSREFIVRAVWGRETKVRDGVDVAMSIIGQAYGTYASNRDAYDRLRFFYEELVFGMKTPENLAFRMNNRLGHDDIKKMRQAGISPAELLNGFPTWETLIAKNVYDASYQENTILPLDLGEPLELDYDMEFY